MSRNIHVTNMVPQTAGLQVRPSPGANRLGLSDLNPHLLCLFVSDHFNICKHFEIYTFLNGISHCEFQLSSCQGGLGF